MERVKFYDRILELECYFMKKDLFDIKLRAIVSMARILQSVKIEKKQ